MKVIHPQIELDEACNEVVGLEILCQHNSGILHSFCFAFPIILDLEESNDDIVTATCQRSMMIDTDDGKMTAMCAGVGTCSATYSCPRCVRRSSSRSCVKKWLEELRHLFPEDMTFEDCPLREGEVYGYDHACQKKGVDRLGPNDDCPLRPSVTQMILILMLQKVCFMNRLKILTLIYFVAMPCTFTKEYLHTSVFDLVEIVGVEWIPLTFETIILTTDTFIVLMKRQQIS